MSARLHSDDRIFEVSETVSTYRGSMSQFTLRIVHHDGMEEVKDIADGDLTIGRGPENRLSPLDPSLSRQHAVIHNSSGRLSIEDLQTRNGTFVNGTRIQTEVALGVGDVVDLGKTKLVLAGEGESQDVRRNQPTVEIQGDVPRQRIVAESARLMDLIKKTDKFSRSDLPILITGETGTGKELFAHRVHEKSLRKDGPFVVLNCPALAPGLVESELFGVESGVATDVSERPGRLEEADQGTLFLDEIADLSLDIQAKLLRFLQDGSIERVGGRKARTLDVRLVAATNQNLEAAMQSGGFRNDLFFRIAAVRLDLPPLREHPDDVRPLVEYLLARRNLGHISVDEIAMKALEHYQFPGNVRELDAIISSAAALTEDSTIRLSDLAIGDSRLASTPGEERNPGALLDLLVTGSVDFWDAVHRPFIDRELPRAFVKDLIALGLSNSGGSVKVLAENIHQEHNYRKLLDFLRNNRLLP